MGLEFVIGAGCVLAGATVVFAWMAFMIASPKLGGFALVVAVAFAVVALVAAIEHDEPDGTTTTQTATATPTPAGDYFASNLAAFRGPATLTASRLRKPLCLVRYYDRATARKNDGDPGANWWTTCAANRRLHSIADVRRVLALPHAWGARNGRVRARIPAGEQVTYMRGVAARQCEPHRGQCYRGGGTQLLFVAADFQRAWFTRRECIRSRNESIPAKFVKCAG